MIYVCVCIINHALNQKGCTTPAHAISCFMIWISINYYACIYCEVMAKSGFIYTISLHVITYVCTYVQATFVGTIHNNVFYCFVYRLYVTAAGTSVNNYGNY